MEHAKKFEFLQAHSKSAIIRVMNYILECMTMQEFQNALTESVLLAADKTERSRDSLELKLAKVLLSAFLLNASGFCSEIKQHYIVSDFLPQINISDLFPYLFHREAGSPSYALLTDLFAGFFTCCHDPVWRNLEIFLVKKLCTTNSDAEFCLFRDSW
jgi:hypothetical protein